MMMKSVLKLTTLLSVSLLIACESPSSVTVTNSFCTAARPIRLSVSGIEGIVKNPDPAQAKSDLEQLKAHNCTGHRLCGWQQSEC